MRTRLLGQGNARCVLSLEARVRAGHWCSSRVPRRRPARAGAASRHLQQSQASRAVHAARRLAPGRESPIVRRAKACSATLHRSPASSTSSGRSLQIRTLRRRRLLPTPRPTPACSIPGPAHLARPRRKQACSAPSDPSASERLPSFGFDSKSALRVQRRLRGRLLLGSRNLQKPPAPCRGDTTCGLTAVSVAD